GRCAGRPGSRRAASATCASARARGRTVSRCSGGPPLSPARRNSRSFPEPILPERSIFIGRCDWLPSAVVSGLAHHPRTTLFLAQGEGGRILTQPLTCPPGAVASPGFRVREPIAIQHRAYVSRPAPLERIAFEKPQDLAIGFEQPDTQILKPRVIIESAQRGKPHLPVEPGLMRSDPWRPAVDVASLVLEFVLDPRSAILRSFENDFRPGRRHDGKEAIRIHAAKRRNQVREGTGEGG